MLFLTLTFEWKSAQSGATLFDIRTDQIPVQLGQWYWWQNLNCKMYSAIQVHIYLDFGSVWFKGFGKILDELHYHYHFYHVPQVFRQTNITIKTLSVFRLCCKPFAVNDCLISKTHRYHQMLGFFCGDALPGVCCSCLHFLFVWRFHFKPNKIGCLNIHKYLPGILLPHIHALPPRLEVVMHDKTANKWQTKWCTQSCMGEWDSLLHIHT